MADAKKTAARPAPKNRMSKRQVSDKNKVGLAKVVTSDATTVASLGKNQFSSFVNFVRQQGVVGLAVGLAVGTAAGASVKEIVNDFINPIVGFLIGGVDLTKLSWVVVKAKPNGTGGLTIGWGAILSSLITLVATAFVIYVIVHGAKLDRLDKPKDS